MNSIGTWERVEPCGRVQRGDAEPRPLVAVGVVDPVVGRGEEVLVIEVLEQPLTQVGERLGRLASHFLAARLGVIQDGP